MNLTKQKGQVSVEFLIILSGMLLILLVVIGVSSQRNNILSQKKTEMYAKQVAFQLSSEINALHLAKRGINKTVFMPEKLMDGTPYNISVYPSWHIVNIVWTRFDTRSYSSPIITGNLNGTLSDLSGHVNLSNNDGLIQIN